MVILTETQANKICLAYGVEYLTNLDFIENREMAKENYEENACETDYEEINVDENRVNESNSVFENKSYGKYFLTASESNYFLFFYYIVFQNFLIYIFSSYYCSMMVVLFYQNQILLTKLQILNILN